MMSVTGFALFKVSCVDLARSVAFYERLGFKPMGPASDSDAPWLGNLYGVPGAKVRAQHFAAAGDPRKGRLELVQWHKPRAARQGADTPGGGMLSLSTDDLMGDYQSLSAEGVHFESEPVVLDRPEGVTRLVNLRDPDGLPIQLVQFTRPQSPAAV